MHFDSIPYPLLPKHLTRNFRVPPFLITPAPLPSFAAFFANFLPLPPSLLHRVYHELRVLYLDTCAPTRCACFSSCNWLKIAITCWVINLSVLLPNCKFYEMRISIKVSMKSKLQICKRCYTLYTSTFI